MAMTKWLLLAAIVIPTCVYSQEETPPIDKLLEDCIEKDPSTAGMMRCTSEAYDKWDKELNKTYNELGRMLDAKGKQDLKTAQLEWISFRDKEFKLIDGIYSHLEGTMYLPMHENSRMQVVRKRTLELQHYREILKDK
jgi:uncharacterized protein YecT (DUF1311 family)